MRVSLAGAGRQEVRGILVLHFRPWREEPSEGVSRASRLSSTCKRSRWKVQSSSLINVEITFTGQASSFFCVSISKWNQKSLILKEVAVTMSMVKPETSQRNGLETKNPLWSATFRNLIATMASRFVADAILPLPTSSAIAIPSISSSLSSQ